MVDDSFVRMAGKDALTVLSARRRLDGFPLIGV